MTITMGVTILGCWIGCAIGNYLWQAFTKKDWGVATERSFFEAVAFGSLSLVLWIQG